MERISDERIERIYRRALIETMLPQDYDTVALIERLRIAERMLNIAELNRAQTDWTHLRQDAEIRLLAEGAIRERTER